MGRTEDETKGRFPLDRVVMDGEVAMEWGKRWECLRTGGKERGDGIKGTKHEEGSIKVIKERERGRRQK